MRDQLKQKSHFFLKTNNRSSLEDCKIDFFGCFCRTRTGQIRNNCIHTVSTSEEKQTSTVSLARRFLAFFVVFFSVVDWRRHGAALLCSAVPSSELREKWGPASQSLPHQPLTDKILKRQKWLVGCIFFLALFVLKCELYFYLTGSQSTTQATLSSWGELDEFWAWLMFKRVPTLPLPMRPAPWSRRCPKTWLKPQIKGLRAQHVGLHTWTRGEFIRQQIEVWLIRTVSKPKVWWLFLHAPAHFPSSCLFKDTINQLISHSSSLSVSLLASVCLFIGQKRLICIGRRVQNHKLLSLLSFQR